MSMNAQAVLNLLAKRQVDRFLGTHKHARKELRDYVHLYSFQDRVLGALILSPSMGPVLFEAGRKVAFHFAEKASPILKKLPNYRSLVNAASVEEAMLSTEVTALQIVYKTNGLGFVKLTKYEKDKLIVFEVYECADCFAVGNIGQAICYSVGGNMAGTLQAALDREVGFIESKCTAKGDPCCEFRFSLKMEVDEWEH
jgi:predicted hydrocarbon binding protein